MTPVRRTAKTARRCGRRGGATLTEVLMALLVMGIGLTSVATLFPLSLLRSVEATKLTNATLARINAEARIKSSVWRDDFGNPITRAIVQDPDRNGLVREHDATKFFYDPLGRAIHTQDGSALATQVGWIDANGNGQFEAAEAGTGIARYAFDINFTVPPADYLVAAEKAVGLPDSFISLADLLADAVTVSGLNVTVSGTDLTEYVGQKVRVTFIGSVASASEAIDGTVASATTITLDGTPVGGFEVGRVTVEAPERRYTWVATVRRFGLKPSVTIAVFFRRSFDPEDEKIYTVNEPAGGYNEFEMATIVDPGDPLGGLQRPAGMKVGGHMFDVATFRWLKIASITDVKTGPGSPFLRFTTDPEDVDPSPRPRTGFPAMFPANVVEAYTLKKN